MQKISWMIGAPCIGKGDLFFQETKRTVVRQARKICDSCAVNSRCLEYALENDEVGVWAGLTTNQRAKILRKRARELKNAEHYTRAV